MITSSDAFSTYDLGKYYVILPQMSHWDLKDYLKHFNAKKVAEGFSYNSGKNTEWLTVKDIRQLIKEHIDPNFELS
jgi:FlaA1/EpsC-like NDP-sugar epimerase